MGEDQIGFACVHGDWSVVALGMEISFGVVGRELEDKPAARLHDSKEIHQIAARESRRHVLERDVCESQRRRPVRETREVGSLIEEVLDAIAILIDTTGHCDHGRRNVDTDNLLEFRGKRLCQAPNPAAKVDGQVAVA
jgi:hypothetical protein